MLDFFCMILAQHADAPEVVTQLPSTGNRTTDYLIAIGVLWYMVKELLAIIRARSNGNKSNDPWTGEHDRRKPDINAQLAHQLMMDQHERMIIVLSEINSEVVQIKAIAKSTSGKCTDIALDTNLIKDRLPRS